MQVRRISHANRSQLLAVGSHLRNAFSNPGVTRRDELALVLWSSPTRDPATRPTCHTRGNGRGAAPSSLRACTWNWRPARHGQVSNRRAGEMSNDCSSWPRGAPVPCHNSGNTLSWYFLYSSGRSPVLVDRPVDDLPAPDPAGNVDRLAGLMQRWSLLARLVGAMFVVMLRVLGEDPPEVSFTVDQQVVEALAP